MPSEADTCRKYVVPLLQSAAWENEPLSIAEQAEQPEADPFDFLWHLAFNLQLVALRKHLLDMLKLPPKCRHGNVNDIIGKFSGAERTARCRQSTATPVYTT